MDDSERTFAYGNKRPYVSARRRDSTEAEDNARNLKNGNRFVVLCRGETIFLPHEAAALTVAAVLADSAVYRLVQGEAGDVQRIRNE